MADLDGVIRVRKWELDEKRRALGQLLDQELRALDAIERHRQDMDDQARMAAQDSLGAGMGYGMWLKKARKKSEALDRALRQIREAIERARDDMAEAFKELKTLEIAQEARLEAARMERERKEQIALDEMGIEMHRRGADRGTT